MREFGGETTVWWCAKVARNFKEREMSGNHEAKYRKNNEMSEKHEDQFPLGPFLSTPASCTGDGGGECGTIAALSWSQIKNNYFLRLILNQEGVDTRRGCFSSEKRAAIIPPIRFLSMKY